MILFTKRANFDLKVKFDKMSYFGLQYIYSISAAVNKMASPSPYFVCIAIYYSFLNHTAVHH